MRGEDEFLKNIKTCVRADASFVIKMGQHWFFTKLLFQPFDPSNKYSK
jgi:hypothetical protein